MLMVIMTTYIDWSFVLGIAPKEHHTVQAAYSEDFISSDQESAAMDFVGHCPILLK